MRRQIKTDKNKLQLLEESNRVMTHHFRTKIKKTGSNGVFRNEKGAIDLASIMVGIIVIGLVGGVIAATVFAIIPWSQDNAAKQQLDSVVGAQAAYRGLSSGAPPSVPEGSPVNSYGDSANLEKADLLTRSDGSYCVVLKDSGNSYKAFAKSSSGAYFVVTDKSTKPAKTSEGAIPNSCNEMKTPYIDVTPKRTVLTYRCDTSTLVQLPIRERTNAGTVTWSDGEVTTAPLGSDPITKTLDAGVEYTITYDGTYQLFSGGYAGAASSACLRSLDYWGLETGVVNASNAFNASKNIIDVPAHIPPTIKNTSYMFGNATSINDSDISNWNTSEITDMSGMFNGASSFNQDLDNWDVSKVTNVRYMFTGSGLNQDLSSWVFAAVPAREYFAPTGFPKEFLPAQLR